jgi:hypothetical protein
VQDNAAWANVGERVAYTEASAWPIADNLAQRVLANFTAQASPRQAVELSLPAQELPPSRMTEELAKI